MLYVFKDSLPTPPISNPSRFDEWWTAHGTALAALSMVRVAGLAFCCYLIMISLLAMLAALTRWQWLVVLTRWATTPALRRLLIGGSLAVSLSAQPAIASSSTFFAADVGPVARDVVGGVGFSVTDVGPVARDVVGGVGFSVTDVGPVARDVVAGVGFSVTDVGPVARDVVAGVVVSAESLDTPEPYIEGEPAAISQSSLPQMWSENTRVVVSGDTLWDIAADTVASRSGSADSHSVIQYWLSLIEVNSDVLGDDPDVIYPGQVINLPD